MEIDFWNRNKVRELQRELEDKDGSVALLKARIEELDKKIRGDRVCGGYCEKCGHAIKTEKFYPGGMAIKFLCELDCQCKDFSRKEEK